MIYLVIRLIFLLVVFASAMIIAFTALNQLNDLDDKWATIPSFVLALIFASASGIIIIRVLGEIIERL